MTQEDIARIAQVSQSTVSRVLAGDDRVEPSIRVRVVEAMREHNYRPDVRARSLRSKRTGLIGLVVRRAQNGLQDDPFFASLIGHIVRVLSEYECHLCFDLAESASGEEAVYDELLRSRRVDGLILVEPEARDERILRLQEDRFPFVLIGNPGEGNGLVSVDNDNVEAGALATKHLLEAGYRRVGMLAGPLGVAVSDDRIAGYRQAMQEAGRAPCIGHAEFGFESAAEVAQEWLGGEQPPDALVVLDDFMAMGVVRAARRLDRSIPDQVGLVSFNNSRLCDLLDCGLTSVSLNLETIVRVACERLMHTVAGRIPSGPQRTLIASELRARGSSRGPSC